FRSNAAMAAIAATGVILSATYMLWMFQRVNYGPVTNEKNASLPDLAPREWAVIVPVIAVAVGMGVFPNVFLPPLEPSVTPTPPGGPRPDRAPPARRRCRQTRPAKHQPRTPNHETRTQNHEPRTQTHQPRTQNHEPRTQNHEPRTRTRTRTKNAERRTPNAM